MKNQKVKLAVFIFLVIVISIFIFYDDIRENVKEKEEKTKFEVTSSKEISKKVIEEENKKAMEKQKEEVNNQGFRYEKLERTENIRLYNFEYDYPPLHHIEQVALKNDDECFFFFTHGSNVPENMGGKMEKTGEGKYTLYINEEVYEAEEKGDKLIIKGEFRDLKDGDYRIITREMQRIEVVADDKVGEH